MFSNRNVHIRQKKEKRKERKSELSCNSMSQLPHSQSPPHTHTVNKTAYLGQNYSHPFPQAYYPQRTWGKRVICRCVSNKSSIVLLAARFTARPLEWNASCPKILLGIRKSTNERIMRTQTRVQSWEHRHHERIDLRAKISARKAKMICIPCLDSKVPQTSRTLQTTIGTKIIWLVFYSSATSGQTIFYGQWATQKPAQMNDF